MERTVVQRVIYSVLFWPPPGLTFNDQFALRPTGSPEAAIITSLQTMTGLLENNAWVAVIALDFSKAFDNVRHSTLLEKIVMLDITDLAYN